VIAGLAWATPAPGQAATGTDDPLGSPSRYSILQAHDLWLAGRRIDDPGRPNLEVGWTQANAAQTAFDVSSPLYRDVDAPPGPEDSQPMAVQSAGRFRDPFTPQVLIFQRGVLDSGSLTYQLNPLNQRVETAPLPGGPIPSYFFSASPLLFDPHGDPDATAPYTMTAGDLDRAVDADGHRHDEAALVIGDQAKLDVRVVDYAATPGRVTVGRLPASNSIPIGGGRLGRWVGGSLAAGIGDFDMDGQNELAVAYQVLRSDGWWDLKLAIFTYRDGKLELAATPALPPAVAVRSGAPRQSLDLAVGDFDGRGRDEIAISQFGRNDVVSGTSLMLVGLDDHLAVADVGQGVVAGMMDPVSGGRYNRDMRPRLAAGLFKFEPDPTKGYTLQRRQLVLAYPDPGGQPRVQVFDVVRGSYRCGAASVDRQPDCTLTPVALTGAVPLGTPATKEIGLAAGNFGGGTLRGDPRWSFATSDDAGHLLQLWRLTPGPGVDGTPFNVTTTASSAVPARLGAVGLVAYDRRGRSLVLGAPARFSFSGIPSLTAELQDAPKHADWIDGHFINVDRSSDFAVSLTDKTGKEYATSTTTTSSSTIGGSVTADVGATGTLGLKGFADVDLSADLRGSFAYQYAEDQASYDRQGGSTDRVVRRSSGNDDIVTGQLLNFSIWRYPILGPPLRSATGATVVDPRTGRPFYGYYEIEVPSTPTDFDAGGLDLSFYQPQHENGNVLSYPQLPADGIVPMPDLGSYSFQGQTVHEPLFNDAYFVNATKGGIDFQIDEAHGGGTDRTSKNTLSGDSDVRLAGSAGFSIPGLGGAKEHACLDLHFDDEQSWGDLATSENTTTTSSVFSLDRDKAAIASDAYQAGTAMYYTTAGVQKMTHAVDLTAPGSQSGRAFWVDHYSGADPALNLPFRIDMAESDSTTVSDVAQWNPESSHQKLRQFFVLRPEDPDHPALSRSPVTVPPTAGDKVLLQVRVYNYSVKDATGPVDVRFVAQRVNDEDGQAIPGTKPITIGTVTTGSLTARESRLVEIPWTTVGPSDNVGEQTWRIFVILDPDNKIPDETHEWQDRFDKPPLDADNKPFKDPLTGKLLTLESGQNNQGYGALTVHAPASARLGALHAPATRRLGALQETDPPCEPKDAAAGLGGAIDTRMHPQTLMIASRAGHFTRDARRARARTGRRVTLRVRVKASGRTLRRELVLLYDGNSRKGGKLIGGDYAEGVSDTSGTSVFFSWLPRKAGLHHLYARVVEHSNDARPGNASSRLNVRVHARHFARARLRRLTARVAASSYPVRVKRALVAEARLAFGAMRQGRLRATQRLLLRFMRLAGVGEGRTVYPREVRRLRFAARQIRADLRVGHLARLARRAGGPIHERRALRRDVARIRRALTAGELPLGRRGLRALVARARMRNPALATAAHRLEVQLR
jgi:hypothetical protein